VRVRRHLAVATQSWHLVSERGFKKQYEDCLAEVHELRSLTRLLPRSFVAFAANPPSCYGKSFFKEHLDATLVHATEREKLRTSLAPNRS